MGKGPKRDDLLARATAQGYTVREVVWRSGSRQRDAGVLVVCPDCENPEPRFIRREKIPKASGVRCRTHTQQKYFEDPARRAQRSEQIRRQFEDPERMRKALAVVEELASRPDVRAKRSESVRRSWQDPARRQAHDALMSRLWSDPDHADRRRRATQEGQKVRSAQRIYVVGGGGIAKVGRTAARRGYERFLDHRRAGLDPFAVWLVWEGFKAVPLVEQEAIAAVRDVFPPVPKADLGPGAAEAVYATGDELAELMLIVRGIVEGALPGATLEVWEPLPALVRSGLA